MHPYLHPGEWLVSGRFLDPNGGESLSTGAAMVTASEQFPEILRVAVELRWADDGARSPAQSSSYHLELVGASQVRFRMDSIALAAVMVGIGTFTDRSLTLSYQSPDRRFVGFESFVVVAPGELLACGTFLADGVVVKTWEVHLERVPLRQG
jgi:hypothetical protein